MYSEHIYQFYINVLTNMIILWNNVSTIPTFKNLTDLQENKNKSKRFEDTIFF